MEQALLERVEAYLRAPKKQVTNQVYGDLADPITERFEQTLQKSKGECFRDELMRLYEKSGYEKYSDLYTASNISRFTFSKIMNYAKEYTPSKRTVAALCIGLKLGLEDAQGLYQAAGYHMRQGDFTDLVLCFFIREKRYDIYEVNLCLEMHGQPILGERLRLEQEELR